MRRRTLIAGAALTPLAVALLAACGRDDDGTQWPDGMLPIVWDRDTCARCGMAISDRRFASEVRGGPKKTAVKFDDIGCAATWCSEKLREFPWLGDAATRWWVADFASGGTRWLDARSAHYVRGNARSPMGYDYAAHAATQPGSLAFDEMSRSVAATWPADCEPGADVRAAGAAASGAAR